MSNGFWSYLLKFDYDFGKFDEYVRLGCQVVVVGTAIIAVKSFDGETCGQPVSLWLPQTWVIAPACFVRGLVQNVPNDFLKNNPSTVSQPNNNIIQPNPRQETLQQGR